MPSIAVYGGPISWKSICQENKLLSVSASKNLHHTKKCDPEMLSIGYSLAHLGSTNPATADTTVYNDNPVPALTGAKRHHTNKMAPNMSTSRKLSRVSTSMIKQ